jgi:hypothetical protein
VRGSIRLPHTPNLIPRTSYPEPHTSYLAPHLDRICYRTSAIDEWESRRSDLDNMASIAFVLLVETHKVNRFPGSDLQGSYRAAGSDSRD